MSLVTTLPQKGQEAKIYEIPDSELAKFEAAEANQTSYDEGKEKLSSGEQLAGGLDLDDKDVQAYGNICICWIRIGRRWYYRYQYCWQHCP